MFITCSGNAQKNVFTPVESTSNISNACCIVRLGSLGIKSSPRICQRNRARTTDRIFRDTPTSKRYTAAFNPPFSLSVGLIRGGPAVGLDR